MSLTNYSHEEIADLSMIELASEILAEEKKAKDFREVYERITELKGFTDAQKDENIAQFYTDLNTDGRFLTIGSNLWGLKDWYPIEQIEEEITEAPKKKKKKAKAKTSKRKKEDIYVEEEVDEDLDELEEDLDFDDIDTTDEFANDNDEDFNDEDDDTDNADEDSEYDGDFRSGKLDDEDQKVVEEDVSYVGDEDDDDENDDNYN
ncbi:DNA-directed RNA polymerase subunit delta [Sediminibacillus halophilus]|uniref:Probable DNA-directed RNA polymerase subunit delta n=1 Tax=Sediminibacillus halophilus TaxID=482461 RepID=A0A1G9TXT3_9BACI|nr:DNA-directed RNA polymerase subunit delta [Sediminibacillus halophilus]SDM52401.1 DNA-directed RNA polymerase subunit delta [Sediminibacillus halophilus]